MGADGVVLPPNPLSCNLLRDDAARALGSGGPRLLRVGGWRSIFSDERPISFGSKRSAGSNQPSRVESDSALRRSGLRQVDRTGVVSLALPDIRSGRFCRRLGDAGRLALALRGAGRLRHRPPPGTVAADAPPRDPAPPFVEVARESGIDFVHENGAAGELYYPELMQGGVALLDADGDGWLDAFLVQSGPLPPVAGGGAGDRLWRNRGDGTFEERTARRGSRRRR